MICVHAWLEIDVLLWWMNRKKTCDVIKKRMVREKTMVTGVIEQVRRWKWTWAGHVSRIRDNRWSLHITTCKPYERKTSRGRQARRRRDELDDYWKGIWQRIAQE